MSCYIVDTTNPSLLPRLGPDDAERLMHAATANESQLNHAVACLRIAGLCAVYLVQPGSAPGRYLYSAVKNGFTTGLLADLHNAVRNQK